MVSRHGYEVWRASEFVNDLKDLLGGTYKLKLDVPDMDHMILGDQLEEYGMFGDEEWMLAKESHEADLRRTKGISRAVRDADIEGRSPGTALSLLHDLACLSENVSYDLTLYQRFEERSNRNPLFREIDLHLMAKKIPVCIEILADTHQHLADEENNLYYSIEGLFKTHLRSIAERFKKETPRDSWKPVWLLLHPYGSAEKRPYQR